MEKQIHIKTFVSKSSNLLEKEAIPFEQQVHAALNRGLVNTNREIYCNIGIDGNIPKSIERQLSKVKNNTFVGFVDNSIDVSCRRAVLFELMAIKDEKIKSVNLVVILISGNPINQPDNTNDTDRNSSHEKEDDEDKLPSYEATAPKFDFHKVILDETTKNQILRSIALINNQNLIFNSWGFREVDPNTKTILCFYGAPGTGKTMCAHALAKELGKKILIASYASIESKWVGEGPKNMRKIFNDATNQNAVLFFDEADSFLSKRVNNAETGSDKHYNRMSNEMFQLLEDFDGIVIFATNLVTDFDKAFKSRILSFIEFTLPDLQTRKQLICSMIPSKLPLVKPLSENDLETLAGSSEGFSGREIRKALLTSLSEAALKSKSELSVDDLLLGFIAVQNERKSIEETASRERNIISDYLEVTEQNRNIIDVCQWGINQFDNLTDSTKETFYKICNVLNLEMPDLTVSYKDKNIDSSCRSIIDNNRVNETLRYIVYLFGNLNINYDQVGNILDILCEKLEYADVDKYKNYFKSFKSTMI